MPTAPGGRATCQDSLVQEKAARTGCAEAGGLWAAGGDAAAQRQEVMWRAEAPLLYLDLGEDHTACRGVATPAT